MKTSRILTLDGKQEYLEIDANGYRLYCFRWVLGSVVLGFYSQLLMEETGDADVTSRFAFYC